MMRVKFELTDTFGGEANYSWVRRERIAYYDKPSDRALVRRAKKWAGITGEKCEVEKSGYMITVRPRNQCQVLFIIVRYE